MAPYASRLLLYFLCLVFLVSCSTPRQGGQSSPALVRDSGITNVKPPLIFNKEDDYFDSIFSKLPGKFDSIRSNRRNWDVQIIYTQVNRDRQGLPEFRHHYFNRGNSTYYYPASTVKFPIVLLALQRLHELSNKEINRNSTMITQAAFSGQTVVYNDPNTADGRPSIGQYIKKILLVSDNDAFNRLYEFLGQEYINDQLHRKGYTDAQILHRLDIFLTEEENRHTNPVSFYDSSNRLLFSQPMLYNRKQYRQRNDMLGTAYYSKGQLLNKSMDFSRKNRLRLEDMHSMLTGLVFPGYQKASRRFNLTEEDRAFVLKYMSAFPGESVFPAYDTSYHDAYVKFLLYGSAKGSQPKNIRIFNKSGNAYGQLVDVAYIVDFDNKVEFFVSAAINCNMDGILNDDKYEYNSIGFPFLANLGKALYEFELERKKINVPDLSPFIFSYDK